MPKTSADKLFLSEASQGGWESKDLVAIVALPVCPPCTLYRLLDYLCGANVASGKYVLVSFGRGYEYASLLFTTGCSRQQLLCGEMDLQKSPFYATPVAPDGVRKELFQITCPCILVDLEALCVQTEV